MTRVSIQFACKYMSEKNLAMQTRSWANTPMLWNNHLNLTAYRMAE